MLTLNQRRHLHLPPDMKKNKHFRASVILNTSHSCMLCTCHVQFLFLRYQSWNVARTEETFCWETFSLFFSIYKIPKPLFPLIQTVQLCHAALFTTVLFIFHAALFIFHNRTHTVLGSLIWTGCGNLTIIFRHSLLFNLLG